MSANLNVCVFSGLKVTNTWRWSDGSLLVRCQMRDPTGGYSFITLIVRHGNDMGLQFRKGDALSVQRAVVRSRDLAEPLETVIGRATVNDRPFTLKDAVEAAGLSQEQRGTLMEAFREAEVVRVMTEFLVEPEDVILET